MIRGIPTGQCFLTLGHDLIARAWQELPFESEQAFLEFNISNPSTTHCMVEYLLELSTSSTPLSVRSNNAFC